MLDEKESGGMPDNTTDAKETAEVREAIRYDITDDEFTAREIDERQEAIPDIDEAATEVLSHTPEPIAVEIPEDTEEDFESVEEEVKPPQKEDEKKSKTRAIDNRFDFLELFVFTMVAVMVITTFFFRHSVVDGESMENTLYDKEHLIISDFMYTPKRGDIIVFQDYTLEEYDTRLTVPIVKRVIATEGDTVRVTVNGEVYLNGELLTEDYVCAEENAKHLKPYFEANKPSFTIYPNSVFPEYIECTVPEGEVFVMGDHRDASTDSRAFGTIKEEAVLGRVLLRFYPLDSFGSVD